VRWRRWICRTGAAVVVVMDEIADDGRRHDCAEVSVCDGPLRPSCAVRACVVLCQDKPIVWQRAGCCVAPPMRFRDRDWCRPGECEDAGAARRGRG